MPPSPLALVKWSTELAESLGKPTSAKFIYDWVKASGGELPSGAELKRLSTAVDQGFNTVGYRFSDNAARDEEHLQKMLFEPKRLADENRAFHVDITPGAPAARARAFNVTNNYNAFEPGYTGIRPLALRLENLVNGSDKQANTTRFLTDALNRKASGVRYTPIEGELAGPGRDTESAIYDLAKRSGSAYQPSVAIVDPTAVRDLRSAKFQSLSKPALMAAVALGTTPLLQAKESLVNNPEQMTHKKFVPGANPLVQIPRGFVAGTASLAREGEDLARMFAKYISAPGSIAENWGNRESVLPTNKFFRDELPFKDEGVGADELQTLGSLAGGVGLPSLAKLTAKYAPKIALAAAEAGPVGRSAQRGIIKKPGGNWLSDQPGDSLKGLMKAENLDNPEQAKALNQFINNKLTKYVRNDMATEGDPIRLMAEAWPEKKAQMLGLVDAKIKAYADEIAATARKRGQPEHTLTEMRQEMIKLEKEKALIEAREGLHAPVESLKESWIPQDDLVKNRGNLLIGNSGLARDWENAADANVYLRKPTGSLREPWMKDDTALYEIPDSVPEDLGFNNLIDELRNATNADSGLPAELLWNAKDLAKKTIPDAVEHVSKINAWREAQKVEANAAKAHNAATVLHKDYPDKGFKWVELKAEKGANPAYLGDGQYEDPAMNALKDALKYEGDVMEHCVGGYCPDVVEGRSRIYSLRNTKTGRPHVTIEVVPPTKNTEIQNLQAEFGDNWEDYADPRLIATGKAMGERILQIKGFRNAKPNDEYLPYVQDFVKSGNWADVQDLQNTGLRRLVPESDVGRNLKEFGRELPPYVSEDEMAQLIDWSNGIRKDLPEGFAQGGSVYSPARIDEIVTQHRNSEYDPARVDALVAQLKEEMYG